jgi:hypothetical protein
MCMVRCDRAIYRGHGIKIQVLGGFQAVLTAAGELRPVTTDKKILHATFQIQE